MSYYVGGLIDAATYNYFADFVNAIYGDKNVNSTVPYLANTGYGKLPNIAYVEPVTPPGPPNDLVSAAQWNALISRINACGVHQGVSTAPIPTTPLTTGQLIVAYNDYLNTQTLKDVIGRLIANKLSIASGQVTLTPATPAVNTTSWTTGKQYSFTVDFGSWNNARYFFNLGGSISVASSYTGGSNPTADNFWNSFLSGAGIIKFSWQDSASSSGTQPSNVGFYDLTTTYKEVYRRTPGGSSAYSNSYFAINAKLAATSGTNGIVNFQVSYVDNDVSPVAKTGTNTVNVSVYSSSGAIVYPGPAVTVTNGSFVTSFTAAAYGSKVVVTTTPSAVSATIINGGTATTPAIVAYAQGGAPPYTFVWSNETITPNIVTSFSNPTPSPTTSPVTTTLSKLLTAGQILGGTVKVTVTDAASAVTVAYVNWGASSNLPNA